MIRSLARYVRLNARLYLKGEAPVVVYSKERTGSVALYKSLVAAGVPAIATHYLDPAKIAEGKLSGSARWASKHVVQPRRRAKFITLVRNPIDNLLSTFARNEFVDKPRARGLSAEAALAVSPEELDNRFNRQYLDGGEYRRELDWFEAEFQVALGIDPFAHPFDASLGYGRIADGPFEVLVLRTELSDDVKAAAVADFLGLADFAMSHGPITVSGAPGATGDSAKYQEHYRQLKRHAVIPQHHWDVIAGSKVARHFIDERELAESRAKIQVGDRSSSNLAYLAK
ncbi:MAG: hypothetical protein C0485_06300 [Pirellula sp.]|nr:hypothetical protein [Pirellula sp.]